MSSHTSLPSAPPTEPPEELSTLSAAYPDSDIAGEVVEHLEKAGLRPRVIAPIGPWTLSSLPDPASRFFEHPLVTSAVGAIGLGLVTALASLIWLDGRHWVIYGLLGMAVGVLTGWIGSAMAATAHPARAEDLLAHPRAGFTVEVEAAQRGEVRVAERVMGEHSPTVFTARSRPAPGARSERVMWHHEDGLSPLEALSLWVDERERRPGKTPAPVPRGRHVAPGHPQPRVPSTAQRSPAP
jgi:hypothetical protein